MIKLNSVFQGRSFLAEKDFTPQELNYLIDFGLHLKALQHNHMPHQYLAGKNIALLFEKTSTRTRAAFTTAAIELGAHPEYLGANDIQLGNKETVTDTAIVLGRMFDGIEFRGSHQSDVEALAKHAGVPVWNGLTDDWHPTQMIADFMTIKEHFGYLRGLTLVFIGDGRNNVAHSLLVTAAMLGVNINILAPIELQPDPEIIALASEYAATSGSRILVTDEISLGVEEVNIIYTDVWVSMGETNWDERIQLLRPYQVNMAMLAAIGTPVDELIFMHCLPAFHNTDTTYGQEFADDYNLDAMEVTDEVFNSAYARQWDQAENRKHGIKAVMAATLGNLFIPVVSNESE